MALTTCMPVLSWELPTSWLKAGRQAGRGTLMEREHQDREERMSSHFNCTVNQSHFSKGTALLAK